MWWIWALLSALFAALTTILAKIGIQGVNSHLATAIRTAVVLLMAWGMVFLTHAQHGILEISKKSWCFLILSGAATGLSWLFYVPSFICGTLIGGSIAFVFLRKLANSGMLTRFQTMLASKSYTDKSGVVSNAVAIAAFGVICFLVIEILTDIFKMYSPVWSYISLSALGIFIVAAIIYLVIKKVKKVDIN